MENDSQMGTDSTRSLKGVGSESDTSLLFPLMVFYLLLVYYTNSHLEDSRYVWMETQLLTPVFFFIGIPYVILDNKRYTKRTNKEEKEALEGKKNNV